MGAEGNVSLRGREQQRGDGCDSADRDRDDSEPVVERPREHVVMPIGDAFEQTFNAG